MKHPIFIFNLHDRIVLWKVGKGILDQVHNPIETSIRQDTFRKVSRHIAVIPYMNGYSSTRHTCFIKFMKEGSFLVSPLVGVGDGSGASSNFHQKIAQ